MRTKIRAKSAPTEGLGGARMGVRVGWDCVRRHPCSVLKCVRLSLQENLTI